MVAGMGGLTGFTSLADGGDRQQMYNPQAIMDNVRQNNALTGPEAYKMISNEESGPGMGAGRGAVAKIGGG